MTSRLPLRCQACGLVLRSGIDACPFRDTRRGAGTILIHQGVKPSNVLYLRRGHVVLSSTAESGTEVSCAVRGPDTLLGLEAVLDLPMPYQVWALTDVVLCTLDTHAFRDWLGSEKSPIRATLLFSVAESARRVGERQALQGTAVRRVARFLLQHAEASNDGEPLHTPHRVLAGILGMRPETLSRALAALRDSGALAVGRTVRVASKERLRAAAGD
jgi:CRP-like cAMP-binding protein